MANNSVVVITLSSDEDSNANVESAPSAQNDTKLKVTARKSTHSKASLSATAMKGVPQSKIPISSMGKGVQNTNNSETKSANSAEPKKDPSPEKKTARKSFKNSNSRSAPKVVSTQQNSSNPQCAPGSSKNETVSTSLKHPVPNAAITAAKLPGITITPLLSSNTVLKNIKDLPTARKSCDSRSLLKGSESFNKHFKPAAASTPNLQTINLGAANANRTSIPCIPESRNNVESPTLVATSNSTIKVPFSLSISKLANILPGVSILPLSKKGCDSKAISNKSGKSTETPIVDVPPSLLVSLGKTGVTITSTTKTAVNGKIPATKTATISLKDKIEIQTANVINAGMTNANSSSNVSNVNKLTSGSRTSSLIKLLVKDGKKMQVVKENSGVGSSDAKSGVLSVENEQINEKTNLLSTNKATITKLRNLRDVKGAPKTYSELEETGSKNNPNKKLSTSVKIMRLNNILSTLNANPLVNNSKGIKSDSNLTLGSNVSKTKSTLNDPPADLKSSNAVTVKPVSVTDYIQSMYSVSTGTAPSQVDLSKSSDAFSVKVAISQSSQSSLKKRPLFKDGGSANKKAKLVNEPRINGTHVNLATAEDNMKRITAFKESLKKITAETLKNVAAKKECSESPNSLSKDPKKECPGPSDSQINASGKDAKTDKIADGKGSKDSGTILEKLAHKSLNSGPVESQLKSGNFAKDVLNEKPFKQVTSPKLSLKRKAAAEAARTVIKSTLSAIPLPYIQAEPPEKKIKLSSSEQIPKIIPLPYISLELSEKKPELNSAELNAKAVPLSQNNVTPHLSSLAQQNDTSDNSMPWNSSDSNTTRFKKLLEFSKSFMSATPEEKCTITKNFHKYLEKADTLYVDSAEFSSLLSDTLKKIIKVSKDTFIHLHTIRTELKAYKRRKNSDTPVKPRRPSNSIEESEAIVSNLEPRLPDPPKKVPVPSLGDHLASALHSITSNLKLKESHSSNNDPLTSVPCSSKQADIVENLRLSMPISNGVKFPSDLIGRPSTLRHADNKEEQHMPIPPTNNSPPTSCEISKVPNPVHLPANPVPLSLNPVHLPENPVPLSVNPVHLPANPVILPANDNAPPVVDLIIEEAKKEALFASLDLKSVEQLQSARKSEAEVVNGEVKNLPPFKKQDNRPQNLEGKSGKIKARVKFLEDHLEKLHKKIKKLQATEMCMSSDDENSPYLLEDRYIKKFNKTLATLLRIHNHSSAHLGREMDKRFTYEGSRHHAFNNAIVKLINKRKRSQEKYPNFNEVFTLFEKVNEESQLSLSSSEIHDAAKETFEDVIRELKRRRLLDYAYEFGSYLTDDIDLQTDPAEQDEELMRTLTESAKEGEDRIQQIFIRYAAKQPKEMTDDGSDCEKAASEEEKEATESEEPVASEDELVAQEIESDETVAQEMESDETIAQEIEMESDETVTLGVKKKSDEPVAQESEMESDETVGRVSPAVVTAPFREQINSSLEDNPIEVTADPYENIDLPDTAPATPDTDAHEDAEIVLVQPVARTGSTDVIDIGDSASNASTESTATQRRSSFITDMGSRVVRIDDMIEIEEDNQPNSDDSLLPSLDELLRASQVI